VQLIIERIDTRKNGVFKNIKYIKKQRRKRKKKYKISKYNQPCEM